ncbi:hypothetical protein B0H14DRAFT_899964 [Mycena olivaceomarginata]|nr:hypothetical protein B0H14DRAFT_899964 [Mycena olivaceomarginata]
MTWGISTYHEYYVGEEECRARVVSPRPLASTSSSASASGSGRGSVAPTAPTSAGREKGTTPSNPERPAGTAQMTSSLEGGSANGEGGGVGEREERDESEGGGMPNEGGEGEIGGHGAGEAIGPYDELWRRDDRADWTPELARAHAAFATGKEWGVEWGGCVQKFYNFEAAWGYDEGSWKMATKDRPRQVTGWLSRGRKWTMPPALGGLLGRREATGQAEELWVGLFWAWWRTLQPDERAELGNRELSRPEKADWSRMAQMHGNNGLLQVMAALLWWGDVAQKRGEEEREEWLVAVRDVTWVLEQLLESGDIDRDDDEDGPADGPAKEKDGKSAGGAAKRGNTLKKATEMARKMARSPSRRREPGRRERRPRCRKYLDVRRGFVGPIRRTQTAVVDGQGKNLGRWQD